MPSSMTAYGRASSKTSFGHLVIEMQSVNRKHLEISVSMPRELARFEVNIRGWLAAQLHRGQVMVRVHATYDARTPVRVSANVPLAKELKKAWDNLSAELGLNGASNFYMEMLAHETEIFSYEEALEDEAIYREALQKAVTAALEPFLAMRRREGAALGADIAKRLKQMGQRIQEIASRAASAPSKYREKLLAVMNQVVPGAMENEERILREVCLFADRIDIAEEITRAKSHLDQMAAVLQSESSQLGKTLEFLLQELFREVNTIAAKSTDTEISHAVVDLKTEIERVREQVQNIE